MCECPIQESVSVRDGSTVQADQSGLGRAGLCIRAARYEYEKLEVGRRRQQQQQHLGCGSSDRSSDWRDSIGSCSSSIVKAMLLSSFSVGRSFVLFQFHRIPQKGTLNEQ